MISFGTMLRDDDLPIEKMHQFIDVFREFVDYNFLWKCNSTVKDLPKNVRMLPWLPQSDILGHPKLKAFVTHGGLTQIIFSIFH